MRHARGFTLIELMVTTAVMAIVMATVLGALIANQQQYVSHADVADIQSNLRIASTQLERAITRAGYGIDPNFAVETRALTATGTRSAPEAPATRPARAAATSWSSTSATRSSAAGSRPPAPEQITLDGAAPWPRARRSKRASD